MPFVGGDTAVVPDGVVEAGSETVLVGAWLGRHRMHVEHRLGRHVVGQEREPTSVDQLMRTIGRIADGLGDLHPRDRSAAPVTSRRTDAIERDVGTIERGRPGLAAEVVGRGHLRHHDRLNRGRRLRALERALGIEDRTDRLTGDDAPGREAASVADPVDLVADRFTRIAAPDEVGTDAVRLEFVVDRHRRGPQRLRDDLPAVQPSPRVLRPRSDVDVMAVCRQLEHQRRTLCRGSPSSRLPRMGEPDL